MHVGLRGDSTGALFTLPIEAAATLVEARSSDFRALIRFYRTSLRRETSGHGVRVGGYGGFRQATVTQRFWWHGGSRCITADAGASHEALRKNRYLRSLLHYLMGRLPREYASARLGVTYYLKSYVFPVGSITSFPGIRGHRDGCDFLFTQLIGADNIDGGRNQVLLTRQPKRRDQILLRDSLPAVLSGYVIDDRTLFHRLTALHVLDPRHEAFREILVCRVGDDGSADL